MRPIKRLDSFLLQTFLPLFLMTFGICLFIYLMQFLWRSVDEMVGKGIEIHVLAELFFYAALTFVPQALPLAILFASLMTFGNLGEQFELLAMKASGISLMRIMRSLLIFLVFIAIAAFFFQNNIIPKSKVKFFTLLYSVRQKSPELAISESTFDTQISGKNLFVRKKDKKRKLLKDIMIYDYADGFNNARVIVADSGRLSVSTDKKFLVMRLYSGESFENLKGNRTQTREAKDAVPYKRETFDVMEMLIEYDGNLNMRDESLFSDRFMGKNISQLRRSIDSLTKRLDSIKHYESRIMYEQSSYRKTLPRMMETQKSDSSEIIKVKEKPLNFDSLLNAAEPRQKASLLNYSKDKIGRMQMDYGFKAETLKFEAKDMRWHHTEMHEKFTLSFACLIFFFIGAPLGSIIRKGGLGVPAVISLFLFVFYYVINNIGYKMARDGIWLPWQGMWLSSVVLLPLGAFLTYKAVNDSVILNAETYLDAINRFFGKRDIRKINKKEVVMENPDYNLILRELDDLKGKSLTFISKNKRWINYLSFWKQGGIDYEAEAISKEIENIVGKLENSDRILVLNKTMDFPVVNNYQFASFIISSKTGTVLKVVFPLGGIIYLIAIYRRKLLLQDMNLTAKVCDEMINIIND